MATRKPKYKVGQVVMREDGPLKVQTVAFHLQGSSGVEKWLYGGQGKEAWESSLRSLTKKECGR